MDEALRGMKALRGMFAAFDEAMKDEQVPPGARERVLNRLMFGNPDGDPCAKASIAITDAVAAMDPEKLRRFREIGWLVSAEEAGFGPVPERVEIRLADISATFTHHEDQPG